MPLPLCSYKAGQAWLPRGCAGGQCCWPRLQRHTPRRSPRAYAQKPLISPLLLFFASQRPLDLEDLRVPKKTYLDTMRKRLGGCWLAIVCVLLFSQVAAVRARGIKHRIKWNRKALPSSSSPVTEAQKMDVQRHPGAFIKQGRKLDIDFGPEGNRYYEANYWQFPDGIHYNGCSEANVTKEKFVTNCINTTQAANQEELFQEKQGKLHQRILWRLIRELCSAKHCDFWLEKGAGLQVTMDQSVMLCLLIFIWFIVK